MQELKRNRRPGCSERGSVLAPIIAFSVLITIAIGGFLGVARTTVNHEITELNNDNAFLAAESGLILGSEVVLATYNGVTFTSQTDVFGGALRGANAINGMDVTVDFVVNGATVTVVSTSGNAALLPYRKRISRNMTMTVGSINSGDYGLYLENAWALGGNTQGIRKMDWDGPAHFNSALQLGNPGAGNETHFYKKVELFNIDPATNLSISDLSNPIGHFGNDYRYGADGGTDVWDSEFRHIYNPRSDRILSTLDPTGSVDLTLNAGDSSLVFGVTGGVPYYEYTNAAGALTKVDFDPVSDLKLHVVNKGTAVSGSVMGRVSVYTDAGKNISLPGNLTYADFSTTSFSSTDKTTNSGYGFTSTNIIGLYSGGDILVPKGDHYITGQLFATNNVNSTMTFREDQQNKTNFYLFGTLAVSGFWDSKQGNNQATFQQIWDRRALNAPGLGFRMIDNLGQPKATYDAAYSGWSETNI